MILETKETEGFVAFLDIQGFSNLVQDNSHDLVYKKLVRLLYGSAFMIVKDSNHRLKQNKNNNVDSEILQNVIFSDTILIFSRGNEIEDLEAILSHCYDLSKWALKDGIAINGCISFGTSTKDFINSIYFGKPIIDAYNLQKEIKAYGIIIDHTVEKYIDRKKLSISDFNREYHSSIDFFELMLTNIEIPFKNGAKAKHKYLSTFEINDLNELISLVENQYLTCSGSTRQYIDNTIRILKEIKDKIVAHGLDIE